MTKKKSCKKGYYYCNIDEKCKKIPKGYHLMSTGYLMKDSDHKEDEKSDDTEGKKTNGNGNGSNGNGNGNGGSNGGSNGGGVSEAWSAKYKKSIDCDNPKGFSQKAHCRGRKIDEGKDGMSDHEVSMAKGQVRNSITNLKRVEKVLKTMTDKDDLPAWLQAKITDTEHNTDAAAGYMDEEVITEKRDGKSSKDKGYSLRDWFKGGGWKQTGGKYDGKPCAKQPGQKTKPFCRDADDRAAMSKDERNRRAAKKRREDPNPDRKGKAKMVTDSYDFSNWRDEFKALEFETVDIIGTEPLKPTEGLGSEMIEAKDNCGCGKNPCETYGEGEQIPKNVKKIAKELDKAVAMHKDQAKRLRAAGISEENIDEKCWKGYEKKGMKTMFGKRYPNCVKKEETEVTKEGVLDAALETDKKMGELHKKVDNDVKRMKKGKKFKEELEGNLKEMSSEKDINKKLQKKVNSKDLNPSEYIKNTRLMPGSGIIKKLPEGNAGPSTPVKQYDGKFMPNPGAGRPGKVRLKPGTPAALRLAHKEYSDWRTELFEGDGDHEYEMARRQLATIKNAVSRLEKKMGETGEGELKAWVQSKLTRSADDIDTVADYMTNEENIQEGEKDACYHKVKSRYSVWPSAYASGALVKCRKVGAKNWGNKTKKEEIQYMNTEDYQRIQEYGNVYTIIVLWRGKSHRLQLFFQGTARPSRDEVKNEVEKIYPGGMVSYYFPSATDPGKPIIVSTRS